MRPGEKPARACHHLGDDNLFLENVISAISRDATSQTQTVETTSSGPDRPDLISPHRLFSHTVVVTGDRDRLRAFLDRVSGEEAVYEDDYLFDLDDEDEDELDEEFEEEDSDGDGGELDDERADGGDTDLLIPFCFHAILPVPDDILDDYTREAGEEWAAEHWGCRDEAYRLTVGWDGDDAVLVSFDAEGVVTPVVDALAAEFPDLAFALVAESAGGAADARVEVEWSGGVRARQATTLSLAPATEEPSARPEAVARLIAAARDGRLEYVADRLLVSGPGVAPAVLADLPDELRAPLSRLVARLDAHRERVAAELEGEARRLGLNAAVLQGRIDPVGAAFHSDRSMRGVLRGELDRGADPDVLRDVLSGKYD